MSPKNFFHKKKLFETPTFHVCQKTFSTQTFICKKSFSQKKVFPKKFQLHFFLWFILYYFGKKKITHQKITYNSYFLTKKLSFYKKKYLSPQNFIRDNFFHQQYSKTQVVTKEIKSNCGKTKTNCILIKKKKLWKSYCDNI